MLKNELIKISWGPSIDQINEKINILVNTDKQYQEILLLKQNTQ